MLFLLLGFFSCSCENPPPKDYSDNIVVLYSSSNCNACDIRRTWLQERKIPFEEFRIDTHKVRSQEIKGLLIDQGRWNGELLPPALLINSVALNDNPSDTDIIRLLKAKKLPVSR